MTANSLLISLGFIWPLLLAVPVLRRQLPWPTYVALVPGVVLICLPGPASLDASWFLLGTKFAVSTETRWILAASVIIWLVTAKAMNAHNRRDEFTVTLFLLMLAGIVGAALASDVVGFFCFTTLMGYSFYGLLVQLGETQKNSGRWYLVCLVVADIALFEAMLLAATTTNDLRYEAIRTAMADAPSKVYLGMVFLGFGLRAGLWPMHLWLVSTLKEMRSDNTLTLFGVPTLFGFQGLFAWLPLGSDGYGGAGAVVLVAGLIAILYALVSGLLSCTRKLTCLLMGASGVFTSIIGCGLINANLWLQIEPFAHPALAITMVCLCIWLYFARGRDFLSSENQ